MKKTYQKPAMAIINVKPEVMLDGSPRTLGIGENYSGGDILSKERGTRNEADDFDDLW